MSSTTAKASTSTAPPTRDMSALTMAATAFTTPTAAFLDTPAAASAACFARCAMPFWAAALARLPAWSMAPFPAGPPAPGAPVSPRPVPSSVGSWA